MLKLIVTLITCLNFILFSHDSLASNCSLFFLKKVQDEENKLLKNFQISDRKNLSFYINKVKQKTQDEIHPSFYDFEQDVSRSKNWNGSNGPKLLTSLLPDGIKFINHPLFQSNMPGLVKTFGGEFISLRANVDYNGKNVGTNIGIPRRALFDNAYREQKSIVPEEALATIIFMHGGGTRTTGHHVATNLMNHVAPYNIAVVSFDQLWHGEGPREEFKTPEEYFNWMRSFIKQFISPSGKPVILSGHSLGGQLADMYARMYPKDNLVDGIIAMSAVPDMLPGGSKIDRLRADEDLTKDLTLDVVTEDDLKMSEGLLKDNKVSPLGGSFVEGLFAANNDWSKPIGIKSLYIWGKYDWLYAKKEELIDKYVGSNENVTLKVYGTRESVKGEKIRIGHMIFDHYRKDTKDMETYFDIIDFIKTEILNIEKLKKTKKKSDNSGLMLSIIGTWANNLAFREFINDLTLLEKVTKDSETIAKIGKTIGMLGSNISLIRKMQKNKQTSLKSLPKIQDPFTGEELNLSLEEMQEMHKKLVSTMSGLFMPESYEGDLGRHWLGELSDLNNEFDLIDKQKKEIKGKIKVLGQDIKEIENHLIYELKNLEEDSQSSEIINARQAVDKAFGELNKIDKLMGEKSSAFFLKMFESNTPLPFPNELKQIALDFGIANEKFQKANLELRFITHKKAMDGVFGEKIKEDASLIFGENSLYERVNELQNNVETLEQKTLTLMGKHERLKALITLKYYNNLFDIKNVKAIDVFSQEFLNWKEDLASLQKVWSSWLHIWGERVDDGVFSLY